MQRHACLAAKMTAGVRPVMQRALGAPAVVLAGDGDGGALTLPCRLGTNQLTMITPRRQNSSRPWPLVLTMAALTHWLMHVCSVLAVSTGGQACCCARAPTRNTARRRACPSVSPRRLAGQALTLV